MKPSLLASTVSVLLLEDDAFMSELTISVLHSAGIERIHVAHLAAQALAMIRQDQPDLLICDLALPDADGFEFLQKLASYHYSGGIIILSGMAQAVLTAAHRLASAHGLHIVGAYAKPLSAQTVQSVLAHLWPQDEE